MTGKAIDLKGQRFGRWVVQAREGSKVYEGGSAALWACVCDCGASGLVTGLALRKGSSKSCGCLHRDMSRKHGVSHLREYNIWAKMVRRCTDPASNVWDRYGGRGIKVCDAWLNSASQFVADMGPCPTGLTLDRIDNNGNYEPGNCRWASPKTQARNRAGNVKFQFRGENKCISEIAEAVGVPANAMRYRLVAKKMPVGAAVAEVLSR